MTWLFVFLAALIVGLLLMGVAGILRETPHHSDDRRLVAPNADHRGGVLGRARARKCVGAGLTALGLAGLVSSVWLGLATATALGAAVAAGLLATACARVLLRRASVRSQPPSGVAVVVREMQPGAYGQIRVDSAGRSVVMAAQNLDSEPLPEGCEVIVLTGDRSVVAVRRAEPRT